MTQVLRECSEIYIVSDLLPSRVIQTLVRCIGGLMTLHLHRRFIRWNKRPLNQQHHRQVRCSWVRTSWAWSSCNQGEGCALLFFVRWIHHSYIHAKEASKDTSLPSITGVKRLFDEDIDEIALIPGRRSFGGKNAAVERQYGIYTGGMASGKRRTALDEKTVFKQYEQLIALPRGPEQGRLKPLRKKRSKAG